MFHCLKHEGTGGFNSIADGFRVAKNIQKEHPDLYQMLSNSVIPFQYLDPGKHYFYNEDVTLKHNILTGAMERVRW
jgi:trimethyllysine dioxygenase